MYMDRGRQCNQVVCSKKVPGSDGIRLMPEQQRGNLLKRLNGVTRCNHTKFKFPVIEIDIGSEFYGVCVATSITQDYLVRFSSPYQGLILPIFNDRYLDGKRMLFR